MKDKTLDKSRVAVVYYANIFCILIGLMPVRFLKYSLIFCFDLRFLWIYKSGKCLIIVFLIGMWTQPKLYPFDLAYWTGPDAYPSKIGELSTQLPSQSLFRSLISVSFICQTSARNSCDLNNAYYTCKALHLKLMSGFSSLLNNQISLAE